MLSQPILGSPGHAPAGPPGGWRGRWRLPGRLALLVLLILALLSLPTPSSQQQGITLHVTRTDLNCGGQAPCYPTFQAAVAEADNSGRVRATP